MVQCNFCHEWYHHTCIGADEDYVILVPRFHCTTCMDTNIKDFCNLLFHDDDGISRREKSLIRKQHEIWREMKTQCKLAASNNIYPRREIAQRFLSIMSLSNNGIKNESNNCWL